MTDDMTKAEPPAQRDELIQLLGGDRMARQIVNALERNGVRTIAEFDAKTELELGDFRWIGPIALARIDEVRTNNEERMSDGSA